MKNINPIKKPALQPSEKEIFSRVGIPWKKSKAEVWEEISGKIQAQGAPSKSIPLRFRTTWAVAATLLVLISGTLFLRFYSRTLSAGPGEQQTWNFSDGSVARLNSESTLIYHPFWYSLSRRIKLSGEGYFEVKPGRSFEVHSRQGLTTVLGTRFTIIARERQYEVSCLSGKVRVESKSTEDALILRTDEKALLNDHGKLDLQHQPELQKRIPWIQTEWEFTGEPLTSVISIIESQYNIKISLPINETHRFTGNFDKSMSVENILDLVCTPFGYTFTKNAEGGYEIQPK